MNIIYKLFQIILNDLPDNLIINSKIFIYDQVPETSDCDFILFYLQSFVFFLILRPGIAYTSFNNPSIMDSISLSVNPIISIALYGQTGEHMPQPLHVALFTSAIFLFFPSPAV
jgi:hypothetical protein